MFEDVEQLGAEQPADEPIDGGVHGGFGQPGPRQLAPEHPQAGQRAERHHHAEAGDVERSDAEENRQQAGLAYFDWAGMRIEGRGPRYEDRGARIEVRGPKSEDRGPNSEVRSPK